MKYISVVFIKTLLLLSLVCVSSISAFAQPPSFYTAGSISKAIVLLPVGLSSILHKTSALNYKQEIDFVSDESADLGMEWVSNSLVARLAIANIDSTAYQADTMLSTSQACLNLSGILLESCFLARKNSTLTLLSATKMDTTKALATLSASTWFGDDVTWGFHTSIDLNNRKDAVGDIYQWANANASIQINNSLVPELRLGYTKNLAGDELSYYSVGITFLKQAQLDVGWSNGNAKIDEGNSPRSAYFSFAIQTKF